ncbi:hypothetical protein BGX26_009382, partial [Mortierella sp. AD094]
KHQQTSLTPLAIKTMPKIVPEFLTAPRPDTLLSAPKTSPKKVIGSKPHAMTIPTPKSRSRASSADISLISSADFRQLLKQKHGEAYIMDVSQIAELSSISLASVEEPELPSKYKDFEK